ncbi:hypothetical protein [Dapis sp. BLCC M172]|uniref:hypothetical protein n=1 Tax=Dapis sp. BLCC M172 TaxID=2975281 RepID=UPI003CEF75FD
MSEFRIQKFGIKALVFLELRVLTPKELKFPVDIHPLVYTNDTRGHDMNATLSSSFAFLYFSTAASIFPTLANFVPSSISFSA